MRSEQEDIFVFKSNTAFDDIRERHLKIHASTWWTRIWTIQEAPLPPTASVVYDAWSMSLEDMLTRGGSDLPTHMDRCCNKFSQQFPTLMRHQLDLQIAEYMSLGFHRHKLGRCGGKLFLNLCQDQYGHRQCHDPRDKVYGMLGLMDNCSGRIVPEYATSIASVFYRVTCKMLDGVRGGLRIFTGPYYGPSTNQWAS